MIPKSPDLTPDYDPPTYVTREVTDALFTAVEYAYRAGYEDGWEAAASLQETVELNES